MRTDPPNPIKLFAPPPSSSLSASSSSTSKMPTYPLEVLLEAQQVASQRNEYFDILSYMSHEQRDLYLTKWYGHPLIHPQRHPHQQQLHPPQPQTPQVIQPTPISSPPPPPPVDPEIEPEPEIDPNHPPPTPQTLQKIPDLSHLHWKQRQKRLAQIASGEIDVNSPLLLPPGSTPLNITIIPDPPSGVGAYKRVEIDRTDVSKSASYWLAPSIPDLNKADEKVGTRY
jgi:hypothetical protein